MTVNVLGESYTLNFISEEEDEGLKDCDGYCDDTIKTLVVKQYKRQLCPHLQRIEIHYALRLP